MNRILVIILIISIIGNIIGLIFAYRYFLGQRQIRRLDRNLNEANVAMAGMKQALESQFSKRLIFLHHSVGRGILFDGGLMDSLMRAGIIVNHATYGDEIGENTDICHWLPKFRDNMSKVLTFESHPENYYSDGRTNDIVMFKSCFPNSNIVEEGTAPGDSVSNQQTMANYQAAFNQLKEEFEKYPDKLFIYMTSPPLVPEHTTPEKSERNHSFNDWLINEYLPQYRQESGLDNLYIFDLFDILADSNNVLKEEYRTGISGDSHPNTRGSKAAAQAFMEFFRTILEKREETKAAGA
jgi:hypothetical protein